MPSVAATIEAMPSHITKIKTPAILELERRARREAEIAVKVTIVRLFLIPKPQTSLKTAQFVIKYKHILGEILQKNVSAFEIQST